MDNFLDRLKQWYLSIKDEVYNKNDLFYEEEGKVKLPFRYVEDICDKIFGTDEYADMLTKMNNKLELFNDLLIEKLEEKNANT